jgi:hypothetical protein
MEIVTMYRLCLTAVILLAALAQPGQAAAFQTQSGPVAERDFKRPAERRMERVRLRDVVQQLSPEGQKIFAESMRAQRDGAASALANLLTIRRQIAEAMLDDSFKPDELRRLFARERAFAAAEQAKRHEITIGALSRLSKADRQLFATMVLGGPGPEDGPPPPGQ